MISTQHQFLFIHVPKTGGNSLQNILSRYSDDNIVTLNPRQDGVERFEVRHPAYDLKKHSALSDYEAELPPEMVQQLHKFSTIRNPWDQMISFYFSPHRAKQDWDRDRFIKLVEGFTCPRYYYWAHETARAWRRSKETSAPAPRLDQDLNQILRFEHLQADFDLVCQRLDIPVTQLPIRNASQRRPYQDYYDRELQALIADRFALEIEYGDYRF